MFVVDEAAAQFLDRFFKFESDHQSASAHFFDLREFLEFFQQVVADCFCIFYQIVLFDDVHYGKSCRAGQVISAECSSQLSVDGLEHRADQYSCHRESVSDAFGYGDDVWLDMVVLMGKEFSATAVSTLDFVQNQNRSGFGTNLAKFLHKFGSRYFDTAHSLYSFDDNSAYVTFRQFLLHRFDVIQREIGHMTVVVDRSNDGGVVCSLHCKGCTSVEGFAERNDFGASVIERSQLQRVFIGFGSAVDQKQRVIFITGNLSQSFGYLLLQLIDHRV